MRRYRDTVTEEHITRDDQPGYVISLNSSELGCSTGQVPPDWVKLTVPGGDTVLLERVGQEVDKDSNFICWSYWNEAPDDPIQLKVYDE